jgi:[ribosomal protein S5]-alanine N-acetyltransferase
VAGLAPAELNQRLDTALRRADEHRLQAASDWRAFIRLCFVVGPRFADYPPVQARLQATASFPGRRLAPLFELVRNHGWQHAADHDIVMRAREPVPGHEPAAHSHSVALEPLALDHAAAHFRHALHPDVWRLGRMPPRTTMAQTEAAIRAVTAGEPRQAWAIVDAEGMCIGAITLDANAPVATVAYWMARACWGHGAASSALEQLLNQLRLQSRITRLRAHVAPANLLSVRLLQRLGWTRMAMAGDTGGHCCYEVGIPH